MRTTILSAAAAAIAFFATACGGGDTSNASAPVFEAPPWTGNETYTYQLSRRDENDAGTCVLQTDVEAEPGRTRLSRLCAKEPYRDDGTALVDAATLRPVEARRTLVDGEKNRTTVYTNAYQDAHVAFSANVNGKTTNTTRDLPAATAKVPNPAWHDDESVLWLVRGLPLRSGYEGHFTLVINSGQPRIHDVDVFVDPAEKVTVPAGTFTAWKVRVRRDQSTNVFWVEQEAPHRVVRAKVEDVTYSLLANP